MARGSDAPGHLFVRTSTMLDDDERRAFRESIERVGRVAADRVRRSAEVSGAIRFVSELHASIDRVAANAAASGVETDCRPGCAYCCRVRVEATEPEIFRMTGWVRQQSPADVTALLGRLRRRVAAGTGGDCAFLVDDRCSAYAVRPSVCRAAHSLSVAHCARGATQIPQNLKRAAEAEALMIGTAAGYAAAGLPISPRELNAAVLAALEDDTSEQRWFAGRASPTVSSTMHEPGIDTSDMSGDD
jgi:hypothetical protein